MAHIKAKRERKGMVVIMKKRFWKAALTLFAVAALTGCGADADRPLNETDVEKYVTLGDYSSIASAMEPVTVDENDLNEITLSLYNRYVTKEDGITDRAVETGDTVDIDYEGKKDGVAFAGGTAAGASLTIGSGQFINGFEDGLIGVMPGETVELNLTFPEGYGNAELAGQAVVFTVTVNYIKPGLDGMKDSVVQSIGIEGVDTVEELRQYAYDYLEYNAQTKLQDAIMTQLMAQSTFKEFPETVLESGRAALTENLESVAASNGVSADVYTNYLYGMSAEDFVNTYAEEGVKQNYILQAIANRENLNVSDEELQSLLEEYAADAGYASVEEFVGETSREDFRNYFMTERVYDFLTGLVRD